MKKYLFIAATALGLSMSNQSFAQNYDPDDVIYDMPCHEYKTTKDHYGAVGVAYGMMEDLGDLKIEARRNAISQLQLQLSKTVVGVLDEFRTKYKIDGNDRRAQALEDNIKTAIYERLAGDDDTCEKRSKKDEGGRVYVYIGIRVPKQEVKDIIKSSLSESDIDALKKEAQGKSKVLDDIIDKNLKDSAGMNENSEAEQGSDKQKSKDQRRKELLEQLKALEDE